MRRRAQDQRLADDARLLRAWRRWHADRLGDALAGPHGAIVERVVTFLKTMGPHSASALIELIRAQAWHEVDANARLEVLHEINKAITALRERNELPPFDDGLPGARSNAFQIIRSTLFP
jgi:hypothetical protein